MKQIACVALAIGSLLAWPAADAANQPCSGRKGGIAQCDGDTFICNDGSISASKKSCQATFGGRQGLMAAPKRAAPAADGSCNCRNAETGRTARDRAAGCTASRTAGTRATEGSSAMRQAKR